MPSNLIFPKKMYRNNVERTVWGPEEEDQYAEEVFGSEAWSAEPVPGREYGVYTGTEEVAVEPEDAKKKKAKKDAGKE